MSNRRTDRPIRVLQSFKEPGPRTNPYIIQLRDSLVAAGVEVVPFTWKAALFGRYDIFHTHWPEALIERRGRLSTIGRYVFYAIFLLRVTVQRVPIVSTVHNVELPRGIGWVQKKLLQWTQRLVRVHIILNEFTPVPDGATKVLIAHGHYRDWFAEFSGGERKPGRVLFFGRVRRYKNVEGLVRAFRALPAEGEGGLSLRVVGAPSSQELVDSLQTAAGDDERIGFSLNFADDATLVREVQEASLVVLPYPEMHNSGSVLAALSLDRPVLVPENDFNRSLSDEVGAEWIMKYSGDLDGPTLREALARADAMGPGRPDLSRRHWDDAGRSHQDAYRLAIKGPK